MARASEPGRARFSSVDIGAIGWVIGVVVTVLGVALVAPMGVAIALREETIPFAAAAVLALTAGLGLLNTFRTTEGSLTQYSAVVAASLGWVSTCLVGAIPYALWPGLGLSAPGALFEAASGFTTTGATVLTGLDHLPRSLLLWRSITQWLGGMGVVLFAVAILPLIGIGGMEIYRAEAPGLTKDKITARIGETAKLLWTLYLGLTVAAGLLYWWGGMGPFDALCHAFTTVSAGGFSTHDASFAYFRSGLLDAVAMLFMLAAGTSYVLLYRALTSGLEWSTQPELRSYVGIFCAALVVVAFDLLRTGHAATVHEAVQHAGFQVASILSTTGFTTRDYTGWPGLSQASIFLLFFVGGMACSASGGVKVVRAMLLLRLIFAQVFRVVHPHGFYVLKIGTRTLEDDVATSLIAFIVLWVVTLLVGASLLSFSGPDLFTNISAAAVTLGNIGPGLGGVGPGRGFVAYEGGAHLVLAALMILGRVEIYTLLVLLTPAFWRR